MIRLVDLGHIDAHYRSLGDIPEAKEQNAQDSFSLAKCYSPHGSACFAGQLAARRSVPRVKGVGAKSLELRAFHLGLGSFFWAQAWSSFVFGASGPLLDARTRKDLPRSSKQLTRKLEKGQTTRKPVRYARDMEKRLL